MEMEKEKSLRFEGDLLPEHELINKIKDTLENVCNKLSALSSEPLDNALSDLDRDKKLPSILKLSFYIEEWANNHTHEERRRVQTENDSTREHLSSSQDERARRADGKILSMPTQKSIRHEERSDFHQESSNITASDHPLSLKGNEKKVSKTSSDELAQSTSASKSPISSPSRGPHAPAHGIVSFKPPAESRPRNTSPWYRFSDCILIKPNPLYPPHPGKPNSSSDAKYVRAFCSTMTLRVSLLATHMAVVQRISPTELVYPYIEFPGPRSSDDFKIPLPLPLPVTLEELFYGVTKKVTFSKVEISRQGNTLLSKIHLDVDVKAGMYAGKKIEIHPGRGWPIRRLSFVIYEIEHPVFSRIYSGLHDNSNLQLYYRQIGSSSEPKSMYVTFIDGEQKLIHLNGFRDGDIGGVELKKKGMPKNAVKNGPRGDLNISPPKRYSFSQWF